MHPCRSSALRFLGALSAILAFCSPAAAQTPTAVPAAGGYVYTFTDDPLRAGGFGPTDPRIHVVAHTQRGLLIRPRTQFIAEMLKSVENL